MITAVICVIVAVYLNHQLNMVPVLEELRRQNRLSAIADGEAKTLPIDPELFAEYYDNLPNQELIFIHEGEHEFFCEHFKHPIIIEGESVRLGPK